MKEGTFYQQNRKTIIMWLIFLCFLQINSVFAQKKTNLEIEKTEKILDEIINGSFPELKNKRPNVKTFTSENTYFKSQFSVVNLLTFTKIKTIIFVNPKVFKKNAPDEGIKAILAHELAHSLYYKRKNRFQLLGLVSLIGENFTLKFERRADLTAIERGYGEGLIKYREWLYQNIPPKSVIEKKRNYFTPEEIEFLISENKKNPSLINKLKKQVPKNLEELKKAAL
jgi:hypothetical protein